MHEQTKQTYARFQIPWYRTDRNGTIVFRTPGTAGGGFTVDVARGTTSMDGDADRQSAQQDCNPMP
jgi:beta-lactamase superfamily II metal-dependent hydrolase